MGVRCLRRGDCRSSPAPSEPWAARRFAAWLSRTTAVRVGLPDPALLPPDAEPRLSCWTARRWRDTDAIRQQNIDMFGGQFMSLWERGEIVGELPEARYQHIQLHLALSTKWGKRLYLKQIQQRI